MTDHAVFELRNYLLHPGQRDVLIELFEREFIESQESFGICVAATFRNIDEPDRFVWMRSFPTYETRAAALDAFYTGPAWQTHRTEANVTMIDSDNVLLLRPHMGALRCGGARPPIGAHAVSPAIITATAYHLAAGGEDEFAGFHESVVAPRIRENGGALLATFTTEHRPNNYQRLPVREDVNVFVVLHRFASLEAQVESARTLGALGRDVERRVTQPTETLRLQPTARSLLR